MCRDFFELHLLIFCDLCCVHWECEVLSILVEVQPPLRLSLDRTSWREKQNETPDKQYVPFAESTVELRRADIMLTSR